MYFRNAMLAAAAALALASCGKGTVGSVPTTLPGTPAPEPSKVKQAITTACGFVPDVASVAAVITASPFVPAAGAVVEAICAAVTTIPFADGPGDHLPRVNGVVVRGYFAKAPSLK